MTVSSANSPARPTPPVQRALKHAVEQLRKAGHEIIDWEPKLHKEAVDLLVSATHNQQEDRTKLTQVADTILSRRWRKVSQGYIGTSA